MCKSVFGSAPYPARSHDFLEAIKEPSLNSSFVAGLVRARRDRGDIGQQT